MRVRSESEGEDESAPLQDTSGYHTSHMHARACMRAHAQAPYAARATHPSNAYTCVHAHAQVPYLSSEGNASLAGASSGDLVGGCNGDCDGDCDGDLVGASNGDCEGDLVGRG